jgi:hypothetical protein
MSDNNKDILNGYAMTGTPFCSTLNESTYSGGNYGLNYGMPMPAAMPVDFGGRYGVQPDEDNFLDNLFPCQNECAGTTGADRKACLRDCRGKGMTKSQIKTTEAQTDAKLAEAMAALAKQPTTSSSGNTVLWIAVIVFVLALVGFLIWFFMRKPVQATA